MHSASSAASMWLIVVLDLSPAQRCRVKALDYAIAFARTVAGVHYPTTDNVGGLKSGTRNSAIDRQAKVDVTRLDWNDYVGGDYFDQNEA